MAHFVTHFRTDAALEDAFDYLADFSNAATWDPFVASAERVGRGASRTGARFVVTMASPPGMLPVHLHYTLTRFERNKTLEFTAETDAFRSHDRIRFESTPGRDGCVVHYDADLRPRGLWILADLPLHLGFQLSGAVSAAGLRKALAALTPDDAIRATNPNEVGASA
jgi:hypothetical protein